LVEFLYDFLISFVNDDKFLFYSNCFFSFPFLSFPFKLSFFFLFFILFQIFALRLFFILFFSSTDFNLLEEGKVEREGHTFR